MTANIPAKPVRFVGFDSGGEVFLSQGRVLRGIYPGKGDLYREVLHICKIHDLFRFGIVATRELDLNPHPELPYDLVLEHERIPFVSYPHEWSPSMLKDAALFHLDLYTELGKHGLTIKDWHPYNILFNGTKPVFVDFSSIIPIENLQDEAYLTPPRVPPAFQLLWDKNSAYFYEMYRRMCEPYFMFPLYMMRKGWHTKAHTRMLETTMNAASSTMSLNEVCTPRSVERMRYRLKDILKKTALIQRGPIKHWFLRLLRAEVDAFPVSLSSSRYSDYYIAKGEDFSFTPSPDWTNKQRVVDGAIRRYRPQTLLDIGSNTGWFSILATKLGCQVVALDIDDTCVDVLYRRAKRENLPILPLVANILDLTPDIVPITFENEPSLSLISGDSPLLMSIDKRLRCDMVLALAIIHHLALGSGLHFGQIVKLLSALVEKHLMVEFITKEDSLIVSYPTFFPLYNENPQDFGWYTLDNCVLQLRRAFRAVDVKSSASDSRKIIICSK